MSRPETITLSAAAGAAIIKRLAVYAPSRSDGEILIQVLRWYCWLVAAVQEAKLSLQKLRTLLVGQGPQPPTLSRGDGEGAGEGAAREAPDRRSAEAGAQLASVASAAETGHPRGGQCPADGRLGAKAYGGAERVECRHETLAVGQRCPVCGHGTLYALPAGVEVRIDGQALLSAIRDELEQLRCSACGQMFTAGLPVCVGAEKYSARARAVLVVSRYYLGLPGYRVQAYQAMLGVPIPDATQWDQIEHVGNCAYRVLRQMEQVAAQGTLMFHDDTAVRILALIQENHDRLAAAQAQGLAPSPDRLGMHTTALVVKVGAHTAILYYSSRRHAGENLQGLLDKREAGLAHPLAMSDALASNAVADDGAVSRCHCLAHGRRKFSALAQGFPHECHVVLPGLRQVCDHDEHAHES